MIILTNSTAFYGIPALSLIFLCLILSFIKHLLEKAWCYYHVKPSVTTTSPCFFFALKSLPLGFSIFPFLYPRCIYPRCRALDARASHAGPATSWLRGSTSFKVETRVDCQTSYWHDCDTNANVLLSFHQFIMIERRIYLSKMSVYIWLTVSYHWRRRLDTPKPPSVIYYCHGLTLHVRLSWPTTICLDMPLSI